eukprot:14325276-Heterocapsa_arctica.AAC.1
MVVLLLRPLAVSTPTFRVCIFLLKPTPSQLAVNFLASDVDEEVKTVRLAERGSPSRLMPSANWCPAQ